MMKKGCGSCSSQIDLAARVLIALFFGIAGISKLMDTAGTAGYMASAGIPLADYLVWVAGIFLIVSSVLLVMGWKKCLIGLLLGAYTILVTLIFHIGEGQMTAFLKNAAVLGGLLMVVASCNGSCGMGPKEEKMDDHAEHEHGDSK